MHQHAGRSALVVGSCMTPSPHTIELTATLAEAKAMQRRHGIRHLPVVRDRRVVGVLTDQDIANVESLATTRGATIFVAEAMTPVPYCVPPSMPLSRVVDRMAREKYSCAIVSDDDGDRVLGVFTVIDALRTLDALLKAGSERDASTPR